MTAIIRCTSTVHLVIIESGQGLRLTLQDPSHSKFQVWCFHCLVLELQPSKVQLQTQLWLDNCVFCQTPFPVLYLNQQISTGKFHNPATACQRFVIVAASSTEECWWMWSRVTLSIIRLWILSFFGVDTPKYSLALGYGYHWNVQVLSSIMAPSPMFIYMLHGSRDTAVLPDFKHDAEFLVDESRQDSSISGMTQLDLHCYAAEITSIVTVEKKWGTESDNTYNCPIMLYLDINFGMLLWFQNQATENTKLETQSVKGLQCQLKPHPLPVIYAFGASMSN